MEIQPNIAPSSLFDSLSQKQGAGDKGDMFASMMDRLIADAANRKREQAKAAAEAEERKTPVRPDRPKPRHADTNTPTPRAAEKAEPPRAKDRPEPKAEAKDNPPPRAAEASRRDDAPKADKAERTVKKDTAEAPRNAEAAPTKDAKTDETATDADSAPQDGDTKVTVQADAQSGDETAHPQDGEEVFVVEAELTVTETIVEVITDEGAFALAMTEETASLEIEAEDNGEGAEQALAEALETLADDTAAQADAPVVTQPTPEVDPAAAQLAAAQAAQAAAQAQQTVEASVEPTAQKTAETVAAAKPVEPVVAEPMPGELAADALPTSDEDGPLPGNLAELAAKAKGSDKPSQKGDADAGTKGDGQNQNNPSLTQAQAQPTQTAESAKSAAETSFVAAAAAAEAPAAAKPAEAAAPTSTNPAIAAMEAPRAAAGVDAPQATAHLRPSRGSAAMPQGVQEQMAVHIQKNVSEGNDQFTINLRPVEMGRIDIRLEIASDGRVSAMVAVEKAQTLELLQRDSRNLERALQDAGLKADRDSLNFSLRGEGGNPFQDEARQGGSGRRGRGGRGGGEVEDAPAAYTATLAPGRVDIHA